MEVYSLVMVKASFEMTYSRSLAQSRNLGSNPRCTFKFKEVGMSTLDYLARERFSEAINTTLADTKVGDKVVIWCIGWNAWDNQTTEIIKHFGTVYCQIFRWYCIGFLILHKM